MSTKKKAVAFVLVLSLIVSCLSMGGCGGEQGTTGPTTSPVVKDTQAPYLRTEPADVKTQVGLYEGIARDLAALDAVDNVSKRVTVKPLRITMGDWSEELTEQTTGVYLNQSGIYIVEFVMRDEAGNEARGTYRILVESPDGAPVLDVPALVTVWAENGRVRIPEANVICEVPVQVTVSVMDGDNAVAVENGTFAAQEKAYTVTYTATDDLGRSAQATVTLLVNPRGVINSFALEGEAGLWGFDTRTENGRMYFRSDADNDSIVFGDYFCCGDWAGQKTLHLVMQNNRATDAVVRIYVAKGGQWIQLPGLKLDAAAVKDDRTGVEPALVDYTVALTESEVEGLKLTIECSGGIDIAVDEIYLSQTEAEMPALKQEGMACEMFRLNAGESHRIALDAQAPAENLDAVRYVLTASAYTNVQVGLVYENVTVYARSSLNVGDNALLRIPTVENEAATGALKAITVRNMESYPVTVQLSGLEYTSRTEGAALALPETTRFAVAYGDTFYTPNPFRVDGRYYDSLTIELCKDGQVVRSLTLGEALVNEKNAANALTPDSEYTLRYTFRDLASKEEKTLSYGLTALKHTLSFTLEAPAMFCGDVAQILAHCDSGIFTQEQLQDVTVETYYREKGRTTWIAFTDFNAEKSKTYEFKYVVCYEGFRCERRFERFVHRDANTIDFEAEPAAVKGNAILYSDVQDSFMDERFLFDGGYYDRNLNGYSTNTALSADWSVSGSQSYCITHQIPGWGGFYIAPAMAREPIAAVQFWANATVGQTTKVCLLSAQGWVYSEQFDIQAGVHQYTVKLERGDVTDVTAFTMQMIGGITLYIDDVCLIPTTQVDPFYVTLGALDSGMKGEPYTLPLPVVPEKAENVTYVVRYRLTDTDGWTTIEPVDGKYVFTPTEKGIYEIHYLVSGTVDGKSYSVERSTTLLVKEPSADPAMVIDLRDGDLTNVYTPTCSVDIVEREGETWITFHTAMGDWVHLENLDYSCNGAPVNALTVRLFTDAVMTANHFYVYTDAGEFYASSVTVEGDLYTFTFEKPFTRLDEINIMVEPNSPLGLSYVKATVEPFAVLVPELVSGRVNEAYEVALPTVPENATEVTFTVKYRMEGQTEWTPVEAVDGAYVFTPDTAGTYEVLYEVSGTVDGKRYDVTRTAQLLVKAPALDADTILDFSDGDASMVQMNLCSFDFVEREDGLWLSVYSGMGDWIYMDCGGYSNGEEMNALTLRLDVNANITAKSVYVYTDAGEFYAASVSREGDVYLIVFDTAFTRLDTVSLEIVPMTPHVLKNLRVVKGAVEPNPGEDVDPVPTEGVVDLTDASSLTLNGCSYEQVEKEDGTWLQLFCGTDNWIYVDCGMTLDAAANALTIRMDTTGTVDANSIYICTDAGEFYASRMSVDGKNYTFYFDTAFTRLDSVGLQVLANTHLGLQQLAVGESADNPGGEGGNEDPGGNTDPAGFVDFGSFDLSRVNFNVCSYELVDRDGETWLTVHSGMGDWIYVDMGGYTGDGPMNALTIRMDVSGIITSNSVYVYTDAGEFYASDLSVDGEFFVFTFNQFFNRIDSVSIEILPNEFHCFKSIEVWKTDANPGGGNEGGNEGTDPVLPIQPADPNAVVDFGAGEVGMVNFNVCSYELIERDGVVWLSVHSGMGDWIYIDCGSYANGTMMDTLVLKLFCDANLGTNDFYVYTDKGDFYASSLSVDEDLYSISFDTGFTTLYTVSIQIHPNTTLGIKTVTALAGGSIPSEPETPADPNAIADFENGLPGGSGFYPGPTASIGEADGNHFMMGAIGDEGWLGFQGASITLPGAVNELQVWVQMDNPSTLSTGDFWVSTDAGGLYPTSVSVSGGVYTLTFDTPFTTLDTFIVQITGGMGTVLMDDLRYTQLYTPVTPEPPAEPTWVDVLPNGKQGESYTVILPVLDANVTDFGFTVQYRLKDAEQWNTIQPVEGTYTFTPDTAGVYEICVEVGYSANGNDYWYRATREITVEKADEPEQPADPNLLVDFENGLPEGSTFYPGPSASIAEIDGNHVLMGATGDGGWLGFQNANIALPTPSSKLCVTITMDNEVVLTTADFWLQTNGGDVYPTNVEKDGNTYTLTFGKNIEVLTTFTVQIKSTMGAVTLDDIRICTEQTPEEPVQPAEPVWDADLPNGKQNESYTVVLPTVDSVVTDVRFAVSYRLKDAADWTDMEAVEGVYSFVPTAEGIYEIRVRITGKVGQTDYTAELTREITVDKAEEPAEPTDPNVVIDFAGGDTSKVASATATFEIVEMEGEKWLSVFSGAGDWFYINDLNYTADKNIVALEIVLKDEGITAGRLYIYTDSGAFYASGVTNEGNVYRFTFDKTFTTLNRFSMEVMPGQHLQIKQVKVVLEETSEPVEPADPNVLVDFENGLPEGSTFYPGPSASIGEADGNHVLLGATGDGGWLGFQNANIALPTPSNKLCVTITMDNEVVLTTADFWLQTNGGDVYPTNVEKEGNVYTLTFAAAMETLKTFTVQIKSTMGAVTMDDIRICDQSTVQSLSRQTKLPTQYCLLPSQKRNAFRMEAQMDELN